MIKKLLTLFIAIMLPCIFCVRIFAQSDAQSAAVSELSRGEVSAQSAILIDAHAKNVLFEKNARERMGMASTTKIMTALVTAEVCGMNERVTVDSRAVGVEGSSIYLKLGEILTVEQLLYALLLNSANAAATALAIHVSGSVEAFSQKMNEKARALGLCDTNFVNPHGLYDDEHYTTAYDLAIIAREALRNDDLKKIFSTYKKTIPLDNGEGTRVLVNHNKMLRLYEGAVGMKTGFTKKTGRTLVSAAERNGLVLIAVTLNAPNDWNDHTLMLDYGFENYTRVTLFSAGELRYALEIGGGVSDHAVLTNTQDIAMTLKKDHSEAKRTIETCCRLICAPINAGAILGQVTFYCDGQIASSPLIAASEVPMRKETGLLEKFFK